MSPLVFRLFCQGFFFVFFRTVSQHRTCGSYYTVFILYYRRHKVVLLLLVFLLFLLFCLVAQNNLLGKHIFSCVFFTSFWSQLFREIFCCKSILQLLWSETNNCYREKNIFKLRCGMIYAKVSLKY